MPEVLYDHRQKQYIWRGSFEERLIPKAAGWEFKRCRVGLVDKVVNVWRTTDTLKAYKLIGYAAPNTKKRIEHIVRTLRESRAVAADVDIPTPKGLSYFDFQKAGAVFLNARPATLLADEMGLGKTIQAAAFLNLNPKLRNVLIIPPAHLKLNWAKELNKWLVKDYMIQVLSGRSGEEPLIGIVIINYEIIFPRIKRLKRAKWDAVILDEAHYIKNPKSLRGKAIKKLSAKHKIALTGTPNPNRTMDLWAILNWLDSEKWASRNAFGKHYCGGFFDGFGWDFKGASNSSELQEELRSTLMIRRLKVEVLTQLPPKRRQIVELPYNGRDFRATEDFKRHINIMDSGLGPDVESISTIYRELGEEKAPLVAAYVAETARSAGKLVCFAYHRSVIRILEERLTLEGLSVVTVVGDTSMRDREERKDRFQNDPDCNIFLGNMIAAGTGITLTAASLAIFAEQYWVPGVLSQAEDRLHRIGQTDSVLSQHVVLNNGLDALMARTVIEKQEIEEATLNNRLELEHESLLDSILNN